MTEDERPDERDDEPAAEDTGDLPPPSTWAGRARQEQERSGDSDGREERGITDEFDGVEAELSAEFEEIGTDESAQVEASDADEREEPPDEFEFSDPDDEDELEDEGDSELEELTGERSSQTVEGDTLTLADREAAKEAAHAGLSARAVKSATSRGITTGAHPVESPATEKAAKAAKATKATKASKAAKAANGNGNGVGEPPKRKIWWRFVAASFVIVASMAAATSISFLLFLEDIAQGLNDDESIGAAREQLAAVEGGEPQTILVLGSDERSGTPGDPGRSDTAMLLRVDPEKEFLSLMSLPRDLEVPIPGYGTDRLNAAYFEGERAKPGGGPELAIKTIKEYLDIPINHVVNVDFEGFYEAVNAIDCVYIDVDRQYLNTNEGVAAADLYAEIDVPAGYSKLCGYKALQYVRYRHEDNDLVRGARQQDFIREARQRIPPSELLPVFGGDELIDIFTKNTSSDIDDVPTIIEMLKSFVEVRNAPVRQVSIGTLDDVGGVVASNEQVDTAVDEFLGNDLDEAEEEPEPAPAKPKPDKPDEQKPPPAEESQLIDAGGAAQPFASKFERFMKQKKLDLPIVYPTRVVPTASSSIPTANPPISDDSRAGALAGPDDKDVFHMYKFVVPFQEGFGTSYYGVSGTNWTDPPILKNPSEERTIDDREFMLFYERDKLRLVGWKTSKGSYWVINTLTRALSEQQMLDVAASTRTFGQ